MFIELFSRPVLFYHNTGYRFPENPRVKKMVFAGGTAETVLPDFRAIYTYKLCSFLHRLNIINNFFSKTIRNMDIINNIPDKKHNLTPFYAYTGNL